MTACTIKMCDYIIISQNILPQICHTLPISNYLYRPYCNNGDNNDEHNDNDDEIGDDGMIIQRQ